jgi:hypothetical protein
VFLALAFFVFSRSRRWYHFVFSGALVFIAHIYRIEVGTYGFIAVLILLTYHLIAAACNDYDMLKEKVRNTLLFIGGVFMTAFSMYLVFGWPGPEWYRVVFFILPKFHADSTGFAFPLPLFGSLNNQVLGGKDFPLGGTESEQIYYAVFSVITVLGMFAVACRYMYKNFRKADSTDTFSLLLIFYLVLSLKSAFGRSDIWHIVAFATVVYFMASLFVSRIIASSASINRVTKLVAIGILFGLFNFSTGFFSNNPWSAITTTLKADTSFFKDYVSSRPHQCSLGLLSNLLMQANPDYDKDVCVTKEFLTSNNIERRQLLISHSAALLYPSLGYELPTKYYCLGWAMTEEMQEDLISELEESHVSAVLFINKYRGISEYDIPDKDRLPVYYKWLEEQFNLSAPVDTPLGKVVFRKAHGNIIVD